MIHDDVRAARLSANLTVSEVARRADVPRKQIQALESGANVTLETLRRIVSVIPNLKRLTLGAVDIIPADIDLDAAREAALDLFDVARRLVSALGAAPRTEVLPPQKRLEGGGGAERHVSRVSRKKVKEMEERVREFKEQRRGRKRATAKPSDHA